MSVFTKKNLKKWLNIFMLLGVITSIPIGWIAAQASTNAKVLATVAIIVALFTVVLPQRRKEIIEAIDNSGLPEDDAGLSSVPALWLLLLASLVVYAVSLSLGCATPTPIPTPPPAPPDAGPADIFDGFVADCSKVSPSAPLDQVRACLGLATTAECLVELTPANTLDTVACTVRAWTMTLHVQLARGADGPKMQAEASAADQWIRSKRIGYRE